MYVRGHHNVCMCMYVCRTGSAVSFNEVNVAHVLHVNEFGELPDETHPNGRHDISIPFHLCMYVCIHICMTALCVFMYVCFNLLKCMYMLICSGLDFGPYFVLYVCMYVFTLNEYVQKFFLYAQLRQ